MFCYNYVFSFPIAVLVRVDGRRESAERWTSALFLQLLLLFVKINKNQQAEGEVKCLNWKPGESVLHQSAAITALASQQVPGQTPTTGKNTVESKEPSHASNLRGKYRFSKQSLLLQRRKLFCPHNPSGFTQTV